MIEKRYRAACVILNHQKTAWIVGGEGSAYAKTTTEFVTLNKTSVRGPDLSFEVYLPTFFNHHQFGHITYFLLVKKHTFL